MKSSPRADGSSAALGKESAATAKQFLKILADSDLIPADELQAFTARLPAKANSVQVAQLLIRQQKLTQYQANMLLQGRTKGLVLGNYVVLDKLGAGGMGMVYKARHRRMDRIVAIKVLSPAVTKSAKAVQRFKREVQVSSRLQHANIVSSFDAGEAGGVHFLAMEYVEGCDLARLIKQQGPLTPAQAAGVVLQAARGLEHAHQGGVIHRDIKPSNLLLDVTGVVKILDLGLARDEEGNTEGDQLTKDGSVLGTCDYMAPEQALNSRNADQRADIYSLGCTLFYLVTGKVMYGGSSVMEKLLASREMPAPPLRKVRPEVSKALDAVYLRMVAKKPEERQASMAQVIADLEACGPEVGTALAPLARAAGKPTGANADRTPIEAVTDVRTETSLFRRPPKPVLIAAGAGGGLLVLLLVLLLRGGQQAGPTVAVVPPPPTRDSPPPPDTRPTPPPPETKVVKPPPIEPPKGVDEVWVRQTQALFGKPQFFAFMEKMRKLNPSYKGRGDHRFDKSPTGFGVILSELYFDTDMVSDISPVRALNNLVELRCAGSDAGRGKLTDLSPLQGLKLRILFCGRNPQLGDLMPLKGMPLRRLMINMTAVNDLAPLEGMPLESLDLTGCPVKDLAPLRGMPLQTLRMHKVPADNFSFLLDLPSLTHISADFKTERDLEILQSIKTLREINDQSAAAFLKKSISKQ